MVTKTVTSQERPGTVKPLSKREFRRRLKQLGLSQRGLAARIGTSHTTISRVLSGDLKSAPCWRKIHAFLADPEHYTPPSKEDSAA
ncbi:MAG TPA: helix-turn-helix transcriptional regulator [Methylomirabilota bacterium]|nr:helix-turn-helix transcriptional regulator [Methylomirabilota bacterium]